MNVTLTHNGMQLQEVGDFGAEKFIEPLHLMRRTKIQVTTEPPIYCRCC